MLLETSAVITGSVRFGPPVGAAAAGHWGRRRMARRPPKSMQKAGIGDSGHKDPGRAEPLAQYSSEKGDFNDRRGAEPRARFSVAEEKFSGGMRFLCARRVRLW